jgi:hypothetical protein
MQPHNINSPQDFCSLHRQPDTSCPLRSSKAVRSPKLASTIHNYIQYCTNYRKWRFVFSEIHTSNRSIINGLEQGFSAAPARSAMVTQTWIFVISGRPTPVISAWVDPRYRCDDLRLNKHLACHDDRRQRLPLFSIPKDLLLQEFIPPTVNQYSITVATVWTPESYTQQTSIV